MMHQCKQCTAQSWGAFTNNPCDTRNAHEYKRELARLRPQDEVQQVAPEGDESAVSGTYFITTAAHGYLAVPTSHPWSREARAICSYGHKGRLAIYLEEDCEAPAFIRRVLELEEKHRAPVAA